ncbi:Macrolide export ATP-binding/permease protein MacB [Serratia plymuthica]|nr:Macrolide export ATP-binding/permease protein MacB [Serratia plymuthica]
MNPPPLLQLRGISRHFQAGEQRVTVLNNINLAIGQGEMVAIVGASGSGKSTLMNLLGCLDRPSEGDYQVAGRSTGQLDRDSLAELRREHFGFIFQRYHLLAELTAQDNVEVPAVYAGRQRAVRRQRAADLLQRLGLADRLNYRPSQLSGGQQQRVSIARALMNGGEVILADEPTGALDSHSGQEVLSILKDLHARGHTVVIVTHDMQIAEHAQRIIELRDGEVVADRQKTAQTNALLPKVPESAGSRWQSQRDRFYEAFKMALLAMASQRLRTLLTMLGIIIGIASVVSVVALGKVRSSRCWRTSMPWAPARWKSTRARISAICALRRSKRCAPPTPTRWRSRDTSTA